MKKGLIFLLLIVCVMVSGCGNAENVSTHTIKNIDDSEIAVPDTVDRIATVYGPSYEAMVVLGKEDKIVVCADVQFENFPWAVKIFSHISKTPYLENVHSSVNIEELLNYSPDIVFTFPRPNELNQLKKAGVCAVSGITTSNLEDVKNLLMVYAQALGDDAVAAAESYNQYYDEKLEMITSITKNIPQENRQKVYYAGSDLLTTYGKYSDINELIEDAGGISVSAELEAGNRTQIDYEQLISWNPDYIFIDHGGMNDAKTVETIINDAYLDGRYQNIRAVMDKQLYLTPSGVFYWDMGLQKILLLMYMAKIIHPEEFSSLNMTNEVKEFYQKFYHYALTDEEAVKILQRQDP